MNNRFPDRKVHHYYLKMALELRKFKARVRTLVGEYYELLNPRCP